MSEAGLSWLPAIANSSRWLVTADYIGWLRLLPSPATRWVIFNLDCFPDPVLSTAPQTAGLAQVRENCSLGRVVTNIRRAQQFLKLVLLPCNPCYETTALGEQQWVKRKVLNRTVPFSCTQEIFSKEDQLMNLLFSKCTPHGWNRCSSLAKYLLRSGAARCVLPSWAHWSCGSTCISFKSKMSVPHLLLCASSWSFTPVLCSLCQCSCVCNCITMQTGKFQWLKSNSSPLYPRLFLAGSVPDPIHCTDTQTAVSVWQAENVWGKGRRGLDEFNHHWYQTGNRNHEWWL